jgi:hypothetical protein
VAQVIFNCIIFENLKLNIVLEAAFMSTLLMNI